MRESYLLSHLCNQIDVTFSSNSDKDITITGLQTLNEASESELSFFNDAKYTSQLATTKAAAVLISADYVELLPPHTQAIITEEPYLKLALASKLFAYKPSSETTSPSIGNNCSISPNAHFGKNVTIGDNVTILPGCYVGDNATIGNNTLLYANVVLYHHCHIGNGCIIHAGTAIGSDGYGFAHTKMGEHVKIYQNGNVIVEDHVEIGANCAIDRAVFGSTTIKQGSKLDNLIQIAHNCEIGEHTLLAAQVGLAGSSKLGRNVVMGGQSASAGHLEIGDFTTIAGKGGVTKSLAGGKTYAGFPAIDHKMWLKLQAKLSGLVKGKK
jgi:UDP-3-O-[3-hydroxymyristoyl] glucosamine N-acyltransferase